ncbi:MAG: hypothetical protein ACRDQ2_16640 [Gaiellales bacterium]
MGVLRRRLAGLGVKPLGQALGRRDDAGQRPLREGGHAANRLDARAGLVG